MVDLNSQFRQNAPVLNNGIPASKEIIYLRNVSLQNKRFKLITKANNLLGLSNHSAVAEYNKANVLVESDNAYGYLQTCISPYMISSDFDMVFISSRLVNRYKELDPNTIIDNRALSKVIVASAEQSTGGNSYSGTIYFDYSEDTTLHQTIVIGILKSKVDKAIELQRSNTDTVISILDDDTGISDNWSISRITTTALLDSNIYYLTITVPNETKLYNFTIHSTLDRTGTYFTEVTKKLRLNVTKNNISPYALYRLEPYDIAAVPYSRTINGATLPSKAYNNRKYVQYFHDVKEEIVEVHVRYTNSSASITRQLLTPEFGKYEDSSFIIKKYESLTNGVIVSVYRIKNTTFLMQYLIALTSNDRIWFNAFYVDNTSYGYMHNSDYSISQYGDFTNAIVPRFFITRKGIAVDQAINTKIYKLLTNKQDALRLSVNNNSGLSTYSGTGIFVDLSTGNYKDFDGTTVNPYHDSWNENNTRYNHVIERITGGITIWTFLDDLDPIYGLVGKVNIALPQFTPTEPIYLIGTDQTLKGEPMVKGIGYDFTLLESVTDSNTIMSNITTLFTDVGNL